MAYPQTGRSCVPSGSADKVSVTFSAKHDPLCSLFTGNNTPEAIICPEDGGSRFLRSVALFYQITRCRILKDSDLYIRRCKNLKFQNYMHTGPTMFTNFLTATTTTKNLQVSEFAELLAPYNPQMCRSVIRTTPCTSRWIPAKNSRQYKL